MCSAAHGAVCPRLRSRRPAAACAGVAGAEALDRKQSSQLNAQHPPGPTRLHVLPSRRSIEAISYMLTQQLAAELVAQGRAGAGSKRGGAAEAAAPAGASKL